MILAWNTLCAFVAAAWNIWGWWSWRHELAAGRSHFRAACLFRAFFAIVFGTLAVFQLAGVLTLTERARIATTFAGVSWPLVWIFPAMKRPPWHDTEDRFEQEIRRRLGGTP